MTQPTQAPDAPKLEKPGYSRTEKLLLLLALLILGILGYSYFADIPLRELFHLGKPELNLSNPIGTATVVQGQVLRQRSSEVGFKPLAENAPIFPNDAVMTGPDGFCVILLKNGRVIRITANSLIKLTYDAALSKDGISVDVLRGSLADDAARVVPLEGNKKAVNPEGALGPTHEELIPLMVLAQSSAAEHGLRFTEDEFIHRRKDVKVTAKLNRTGSGIRFALFYQEPLTKKRVRVAAAAPQIASDFDATVTFAFDRPGHYEWSVVDEKGKTISTQPLVLFPEVNVIHPLPPLNASSRLEGSAAKTTFEGIVVRWAPLEGAGGYRVRIYRKGSSRPLLERETVTSELRVEAGLVPIGTPFSFTVEKTLAGGFVASTGLTPIRFELIAPDPTAPPNQAHLDDSLRGSGANLVYFTWSKTNFTSAYELQLDTRRAFSQPLLSKTLRDNYFSISPPAPGQYYWRVRSRIGSTWTPFSDIRSFSVDPEN